LRAQLLVTLAVAASLATFAPGARAQVPLGPEFQVNTYTTSRQALPAVAADAAGNFVVAWQSYTQDGSLDGIFAQRFSASGTPAGSEFQANVNTTATQGTPSVSSDQSGNFLVVWTGLDANAQGILGRRFDAAGVPGPEFQVNEIATAAQNAPRVSMNGTGESVVVWSGIDADFAGVFARRFDATGTAQGGDFRVNTYTSANQLSPDVAIDSAGNFVVTWYSGAAQDGDSFGVFGQRYDAAGVPQGTEFQVNTYTTNGQSLPSVAMSPAGAFVIAWASDYSQDGSGTGIFAQRYDAAGVAQGGEFRVNSYTTGDQNNPRASMAADGSFVVVWADSTTHPGGIATFARRFDASGTPLGGDVPLNQFTGGSQRRPVVAVQPDHGFVAAWTSSNQDGDNDGVFARLFGDDILFRDGFESGDLSLWSSATVDGGDLSASVSAAMRSTTVGLQGLVDDTGSVFVQDENPADEDRYRARFYLDPNGFDPGEASGAHRTRVFIVFEEAPTRRLAAIVLKRQAGVYSIEGRCRLDSGAQADTGFFNISDGPHAIEIDWKRSSAAGANDGTFELYVDGVSKAQLTGLSNSVSAVDFVRMGALSVKPGANGTLYWDEFESRRLSYIGP